MTKDPYAMYTLMELIMKDTRYSSVKIKINTLIDEWDLICELVVECNCFSSAIEKFFARI